jgi:transcriptional regulator of acetoin/glycerol metabolism
MLSHDWPGNVRELINRIRRGLVMAEGDVISAYELGFEDASIILRPTELDTSRQQAERDAIVASLGRTGANISKAARDLGVSRSTMYRLIAKHAIRV